MGNAVPLVQCDRCRRVAPLRMKQPGTGGWVEGEPRLAELRTEGWHLSETLDTCPGCTASERRALDVLARVCPHCFAVEGQPCTTSSGTTREPHQRRYG